VQYKGTGERVWVAEERVRGLTTAWKDESPVAAGGDAGEINLVDGMVKDGYANFLVPLLKVTPPSSESWVPPLNPIRARSDALYSPPVGERRGARGQKGFLVQLLIFGVD
jgi:hypothetical protein